MNTTTETLINLIMHTLEGPFNPHAANDPGAFSPQAELVRQTRKQLLTEFVDLTPDSIRYAVRLPPVELEAAAPPGTPRKARRARRHEARPIHPDALMLSPDQAAARLAVSPGTVRNMVKDKRLPPPVPLGGRRRGHFKADVDALVSQLAEERAKRLAEEQATSGTPTTSGGSPAVQESLKRLDQAPRREREMRGDGTAGGGTASPEA